MTAAPPSNRSICLTEKVRTPFGAYYIHVDLDVAGRPSGASISTPGKEPESQVHLLTEALSEGLDRMFRVLARG